MSIPRVLPIKVMLVVQFPIERLGLEQLINTSDIPMRIVASLTRLADALALLDDIQPDVLLLDADVTEPNTAKALRSLRVMSTMKILALIHEEKQALHYAATQNGAHLAVSKTRPAQYILNTIFRLHTTK